MQKKLLVSSLVLGLAVSLAGCTNPFQKGDDTTTTGAIEEITPTEEVVTVDAPVEEAVVTETTPSTGETEVTGAIEEIAPAVDTPTTVESGVAQ